MSSSQDSKCKQQNLQQGNEDSREKTYQECNKIIKKWFSGFLPLFPNSNKCSTHLYSYMNHLELANLS